MVFHSLLAQNIPGIEETGIIYKQFHQGGITFHTSGWGLHYRRGKQLNFRKSLLFEGALMSMKDPKEVKSVNPITESMLGFKYGQLNAMFIVHTGIGRQKIIFPKGDIGGVEIGLGYYGGVSWGMLKPVYLNILHFSDEMGTNEQVERYDPAKHFPDNIAGRASFFRGIEQTTFHPGIYGSLMVNFEFGRNQVYQRMLETGVSADIFPSEMRIMADELPARKVFFTFFVRLLLGKKWNRK